MTNLEKEIRNQYGEFYNKYDPYDDHVEKSIDALLDLIIAREEKIRKLMEDNKENK